MLRELDNAIPGLIESISPSPEPIFKIAPALVIVPTLVPDPPPTTLFWAVLFVP